MREGYERKDSIHMKKTYMYQIAQQSHTQMMSYLIVSRDGSIIIIDGGTKSDADYLLNLIEKVSGCKKPHISAWFLTHAHSDHINAFLEMFRNKSTYFSIDRIYHHFPDPHFIRENEPNSYHTIKDFVELLPAFQDKITVVEKGDIVTVDNISFEVLYTTDPSFTQNAVNNSSTVIRMIAEDVSVLFLGDLGIEGGEKLIRTNSIDKIKSDIVALAHHGQSGVGFEVYEAISPSLAMWCTPLWLWENNWGSKGAGTGPWRIDETRSWLDKLNVKDHIIAKDGTYKIVIENGSYRIELYDSYAAK